MEGQFTQEEGKTSEWKERHSVDENWWKDNLHKKKGRLVNGKKGIL